MLPEELEDVNPVPPQKAITSLDIKPVDILGSGANNILVTPIFCL